MGGFMEVAFIHRKGTRVKEFHTVENLFGLIQDVLQNFVRDRGFELTDLLSVYHASSNTDCLIGEGNFHTIVIYLAFGPAAPLTGDILRFLLAILPIHRDAEGCIIGGSIVFVDLTEGNGCTGDCKGIRPVPNLISEGEWINKGTNISSLAKFRLGEGNGTVIRACQPPKTPGFHGLDDSFCTFFEFRGGRRKFNLFAVAVTGNFSFGEFVAEEFVLGICYSNVSCI